MGPWFRRMVLCTVFWASGWAIGSVRGYQTYEIDYAPLMKVSEDLYKELLSSQQKAIAGDVSRGRLVRHINILETALKRYPNWVDGLWLHASETFQLGSSYSDEKDLALARGIFLSGQRSTERCLKLKADNPLCQLFLGSAMAKIGTIDGVFSSLSRAEQVHSLWTKAAGSPYNFNFTPAISMQGAVRYALGIFYRLVPDFAAIEWMYGVKGDLKKSVHYHRQSLAMDDRNLPCSNLMLGVALVCYADELDGVQSKQARAEGLTYLQVASQIQGTFSVNSKLCKHDAKRLIASPDRSCGYSMARQQEKVDESKLKKNTAKNP